MPDREKVLLALEHHKRTAVCNGCPYAGDDDTPEGYCPVYDDAIAILQECLGDAVELLKRRQKSEWLEDSDPGQEYGTTWACAE